MSFLTVLGYGQVGQRLCRQAINTGFKILGIADSSGGIISSNKSTGISMQTLNELSSLKTNGKQLIDYSNDEIISLSDLCSNLPSNSFIADCTASDVTTKHLLQCQNNNIPVILANKKPLTASFQEFQQLTSDRGLIGFECTVGAGLPIISSLNGLLDGNDQIIKIEGQLSGTIGYILSELQYGIIRFSQCVHNAVDLGYTESDPRDDLSGIDVARKALILARCMGIEMDLNDIKIEALYREEMKSLSVEVFMNSLYKMDKDIGNRIDSAIRKANRLRYAVVVTKENVEISLLEVPKRNALYNLVGTDNLISMQSEYYNKSPLIISGPGAGADVTAAGILSDIYKLKGRELKKQWVLTPQKEMYN